MGNFRQWLETGSSGMFSADPERDDGSRLTREFKRSYANLLDTGKAALGAVTGSEALQLSAELDQQATAARYAQPDDVQSVTDIGSLSDFGDWLAGAAGQAAGSASQMVLGGGVGGMAVKGLAREAGKRALAAGVAAGSTATSYPQQLGENVLAMREENNGTLPDGALGKAAGIAALQSGLDVMPFLSVARKLGIGDTVAREVGSRAATRLGLLGREMGGVALKEGGTEAAQEALKIAGLEWVNDNKDRLTRDNFIELVDAAALGAVGGGMMGSVSGLNLARQAKDKPWMQSLTAAKQAAVDAYAETGDRGQLEAAAATLQQQKQAYQVADAEADLQAALAAANPPSASAGRVMRQPDQVAASASIPRQRGADWLPDPDAGLYDAGRTDARPISLASRARRTSELERGLNPDAGLYDAGEWDGYLLPLPPATAAATAAGPAAASGSRLRPVFEPDGYDQRSEQRIAGLEQASTEAEIDRIMADNGSDPERYPDLHDRVERIARERKRELLKQELADLRREREKYGEVSDAVLKPPAPVQAQPASADTAPATPGPGAGELLEVATTNGRRIKVRRKELEGEQETLRVFHLNGKRKTRGLGQRIHRQNIEGQPGALLSESVVSGRDLAGKGFSVVKNPKTQEAENRLLLDGYLPIEKNGNGYQVGLLGAWAKPEGAGVEWAGRMRALKPGRPFAFEELLRGEQAIQDSAPADGHPHPPAPSRLDELAIDSEGVTPAERTKDGGTPAVTDATSPLPIQTDSPVDSSGVETGQVAQQKRKVAEKKRKSGHAVNESQTEYAVGGDVYPEISHDRYVSIHAPRGEFGRGFDPSKSVYLPEGSGFNPEDADEAGRTLAGRVRSDGRDRLKAKAAVLKGNSRHLPGIFATITRLVPHKKYRIGVNRIRDHYDAAHVFQVLHGNRARETLDVLVLDRRGKILAAQRMSTGTVDASSVYPGDIVRFVASIPGADHFYTGHNHPSGNPVFSEADHGMTGRISDYAERLPFRFAGMFAIGADEFSFMSTADHDAVYAFKVYSGRHTVDILEHEIVQRGAVGEPITTYEAATAAAEAFEGDGIILMNTQHVPVAFYPFDFSQAEQLEGSAAGVDILAAVARSNAATAILKTEDRLERLEQGANVGALLDKVSVRLVDHLAGSRSLYQDRGAFEQRSQDEMYSRKPAQANNGSTVQSMRDELASRLGAARVAALERAGRLKLVADSVAALPGQVDAAFGRGRKVVVVPESVGAAVLEQAGRTVFGPESVGLDTTRQAVERGQQVVIRSDDPAGVVEVLQQVC